jgi:antitoxin (DNA-binding transcriptional repressor) of toxin-antitoxin stability system
MNTVTFSHLRTHASELKEALKRGEEVELTSHGQVIGIIKPCAKTTDKKERAAALQAFFQLGEDASLDAELERVKHGRKGRNCAI